MKISSPSCSGQFKPPPQWKIFWFLLMRFIGVQSQSDDTDCTEEKNYCLLKLVQSRVSLLYWLCCASLVSLFGNGHKKMFHYHYCEPCWMRLNPLVPHDDFSWCTVLCWENRCHLKSLTKNMQSDWQSFTLQVLCRVHWALVVVQSG